MDYDTLKINSLLTNAVRKRLMSDRPIAFFLSGGLDSSLIASIAARLVYPKKITTFSVGVKNAPSPDIEAAQKVANFIQSDHHVYHFTINEAIEAIPETIWRLESYDCTTIRASVPMYLLSKYISLNFPHKVILSGEGADELFGGYIYFYNAPEPQSFHDETIRLIKNVHQFDVLRADRCTASNGLELRVPFFDKEFIEYITNINPSFKFINGKWMEKNILRKSFHGYIPDEILWRQKNGMSDAVGYSWVDNIKKYVDTLDLQSDFSSFSKNTPINKEELYYRSIYESFFNDIDALQSIWRPKWTTVLDPSARKLSHFIS
jgi:asparagine synthase (glutamine-hydrolysing)